MMKKVSPKMVSYTNTNNEYGSMMKVRVIN